LVLCSRLGHAGKTPLARFLQEAEIEVVEFTADHWTVAADAFIAYGKGRHSAGLDFGDCMTCAVARLADESLLCWVMTFPRPLELAWSSRRPGSGGALEAADEVVDRLAEAGTGPWTMRPSPTQPWAATSTDPNGSSPASRASVASSTQRRRCRSSSSVKAGLQGRG
jgi:hypothetical protein